ncbi:NAD(P)-binding domain-containing protein [Streptomyces spirodelae]|uniref:NAD(P)-binding domain-containing protein n=1 Tax=Streptomyces spirodelae TaxID=2812904 RepID=A0ABS3WT33_9ACTN|nr:NAD(P)-binding domain-containing protein [Streptomyces spirodelae]MBO8186269.1 NAD(P)-binding domain-containing protein [Streptomyces spirodelae]
MYDLVVVGAGPYGLSIASHAAAAGLRLRVLGRPMASWRDHMPRGMLLKSEPSASALSDPEGAHTLTAYCADRGVEAEHGRPLPLETFTEYGTWFGRHAAPPAEELTVTRIVPHPSGFRIGTAEGEQLTTRTVALAIGAPPFAHRPAPLRGLPRELVSHSSHHRDLSRFRGEDVTVIGAGQSALETAALLAEHGAEPRLVTRAPRLRWDAPPKPLERNRIATLFDPHSALGAGWPAWVWSRRPGAVRRLPPSVRLHLTQHAPGPAGAWWLRERFEPAVPTLLGHTITAADRTGGGLGRVGDGPGGGVRLWLKGSDGTARTLETGHVVAATGFVPDLFRLGLLDSTLRETLRRVGNSGAPWLGQDFESSHPGLFFAGLLAAPSFGPVMRFVHGAGITAPRLVAGVLRHVTARSAGVAQPARQQPARVGVPRAAAAEPVPREVRAGR